MALMEIARGFELPVRITNAGDGSGRLFVVEQKGRIRIIKEGAVQDTPFLDLSERISCCGERGLLNVAFPPAYAAKQHFYVSYTDAEGATTFSRFRTTADPDIADPGSEEVVLVIDQPEGSHNGGSMAFGPKDGYLYIGSGDGGGQVLTPRQRKHATFAGQNFKDRCGVGRQALRIPSDNPFVQVEGYRDEIWALGLRNPWGFAFDKETGALYIPDAGHSSYEEVNISRHPAPAAKTTDGSLGKQ